MEEKKSLMKQIIRFGFVGGGAFAIDFLDVTRSVKMRDTRWSIRDILTGQNLQALCRPMENGLI